MNRSRWLLQGSYDLAELDGAPARRKNASSELLSSAEHN